MNKVMAAATLLASASAQPAIASIVPTFERGTHDDAFEGATVLQVSPIQSFFYDANFNNNMLEAARDIFGFARSIPEPGNLLFAPNNRQPYVLFDVGSLVAISTIKTYLADDSNGYDPNYPFPNTYLGRSLTNIAFFGGNDLNSLQQIGSLSIQPNYQLNYGRSVIEATIDIVNPAAYRYYRFEGIGSATYYEGARVLEIDAFAAAVPEPTTWAMMLIGFGMVGATVRYRRRKMATTYA